MSYENDAGETERLRVAAVAERMRALERWQAQQNGHLTETRADVKSLGCELQASIRRVHDRIDGLKNMVIATLIGLVVNLGFVILNIVMDRGGGQ